MEFKLLASVFPQYTAKLNVTIGGLSSDETYNGDYTIEPDITSQTMETKNKIMKNDVNILAIPYHEVSNEQNGTTVIIGGIKYYGS